MTNLILHILNALVLFGVLRRITGARWRSALVAAWFAVHPLHITRRSACPSLRCI
ncbi:MAG: hypothetical protein IH848_01340 [Acidobacteria bacterium]|nr:hypothetical protein [Acidobacteriota bacterium]